MLLKITNNCLMGCSHCSERSGPHEEHMPMDIFEGVLKFIDIFKPKVILISGGEPTEHPSLEYILRSIVQRSYTNPLLLSNGMFLDDDVKLKMIDDLGINVQITNDARFYPKKIKVIKQSNMHYITALMQVSPFGRAIDNNLEIDRQTPTCFNLRSICKKTKNFKNSINTIEGILKFCTPSINVNGDILMGEFNSCYRIGTIFSSDAELVDKVINAKCNRCGLCNNLNPVYRSIIGE